MRVVLAIAAACCLVVAHTSGQAAGVEALLDRYGQGDVSIRAEIDPSRDLDVFLRDLQRIAPAFIARFVLHGPSSPSPLLARARHLAAAFALEAVEAAGLRQPEAAGGLIDWASEKMLRADAVPDEFDRQWQFAAIAMLEYSHAPDPLEKHLDRLPIQLAHDPRIVFARAIMREQRTAPYYRIPKRLPNAVDTFASPTGDDRLRFQNEAAREFRSVLADRGVSNVADLHAEAALRLGHVEYLRAKYSDALDALQRVEPETRKSELVYLARLFRGQSLESLGRTDDAQAMYQLALAANPRAHSATMALAALEFRTGDRDRADQLVTALVSKDPRQDPWWMYWIGDFRPWPQLLDDVRALLK